jgi:putative SbcD/Mre11-related phosphoesterase
MKISDTIELLDLALLIPSSKTLVISDVHIGYEEAMNKQGILVPRVFFPRIYKKMQGLISRVKFDTVVINGDLKHEFGAISQTEWRHTLRFLDLFKDKKVFLIKGNHDTILGPIAEKRNITLTDHYFSKSVLIVHGDKEVDIKNIEKKECAKVRTIIIGHEHPAISLKAENRVEKYKCFLIGKTKDNKQDLIVMPSFNEITEGTNILNEEILSPYLKRDLSSFRVIIYGEELYDFGKVKNLK